MSKGWGNGGLNNQISRTFISAGAGMAAEVGLVALGFGTGGVGIAAVAAII